jgi:hypothetical protein
MLLSEFIPEILACATKKPASSFYILAKEFPIKKKTTEKPETDENKKSLLSPKADYLAADEDEKNIIIVELKTTPNSKNDEQWNNYQERYAEEMFEHYKDVIKSEVGPSLYREYRKCYKTPLEWEGSQKYASQITYMYNQYQCNHPMYKQDETEITDIKAKATKLKEDVMYKVTELKKSAENDQDDDFNGLSPDKQFHQAFIDILEESYGSVRGKTVDVYYLYVDRAKDSGKFSVRVEKQGKNPVTIYSPGDKKDSEDEKDKFEKKLKGSKLAAWKHLKIMIDAVYKYSDDFDEKKKYLV